MTGYWLPTTRSWLLATSSYWLLGTGYWLLATGCPRGAVVGHRGALLRGQPRRAVGVQADVAREVVARREGDRAGGGDPVLVDPLRPQVAAALGAATSPGAIAHPVAQRRRRRAGGGPVGPRPRARLAAHAPGAGERLPLLRRPPLEASGRWPGGQRVGRGQAEGKRRACAGWGGGKHAPAGDGHWV